jgi:hypothetical protein
MMEGTKEEPINNQHRDLVSLLLLVKCHWIHLETSKEMRQLSSINK